ncbi:MAG: hypothetical protein ACOCRK_01030 [bacterium]
MGEFTGRDQHTEKAEQDRNVSKFGSGSEEGYQTDVEGIKADDVVKYGKEEYPLFKVTPEEFFNNQKADRRKMRFKNGSKVGEYMRKTRNGARPFYIKTQTKSGDEYVRKIR